MTDIVETSTYEPAITQLETTDLVLGGVGGASNRALVQLANRTKWLYDRIASLTELPVAALPYPSIATSDNRLTVTRATATAGGRVSVASGTRLTCAEVVVSSATGRQRTFSTSAYTSADLLASSTYYLRAQVDGSGALLLYTQRGTDSDSTPAGLRGTPDASSGGGFDSTAFDVLLAKVVTGSAGSLPTVTALRNQDSLIATLYVDDTALYTLDSVNNYLRTITLTLNWARAPRAAQSAVVGVNIDNISTQGAQSYVDSSSRYAVIGASFYNEPTSGSKDRNIRFTGHISAFA